MFTRDLVPCYPPQAGQGPRMAPGHVVTKDLLVSACGRRASMIGGGRGGGAWGGGAWGGGCLACI